METAKPQLPADAPAGQQKQEAMEDVLCRIDVIPDLPVPDAFDPLEWDEQGLPQ